MLTVMNVVLIKWSLDVVWTPPREDIERNWIGCVVWHSGAAQVQCRETTVLDAVFSLQEMKEEADVRIK